MAPVRRNKDGLLARVNFPLYTVQMLTSRHILVGGGGGSSKTGVANGFEIFELSHNGEKFIAEEVIRHETGPSVVMNCSSYSNNKHSYLVAGQESHCQLYNVQSIVVEDEVIETIGENKSEVRKRKDSTKETEKNKNSVKDKVDGNKNSKRLTFAIKAVDSIQTDFCKSEPVQRVVRISLDGKYMATGGTDSIVRLWKFPSLTPSFVLKTHKKEIDDIDFSPCLKYLVTIAKDGLSIIWDYKTGKELNRLSWKQPEGSKYLYKRCRFGRVEGGEEKSTLYMLANPTGLAKKQKSFLQKWSPTTGALESFASWDESLSALAVRDDGRFVAIGSMFSGSVALYIAFSMQRVLLVPGAHAMFVTGLEFLPVATDKHTITSISEASVVSISVDNQVCIHSLPYRHSIPVWLGVIIIIGTIILTFLMCSYVGI